MAVPAYLMKLKWMQLKHLSFLLGLPITGTKAVGQKILSQRMREAPAPSEFTRILSIDMGIRNLAVCVLEAPHLAKSGNDTKTERRTAGSTTSEPLTVTAWEKVDVLSQLRIKNTPSHTDSDYAFTERREIVPLRKRSGSSLVTGDFTPGNLADAAYLLVSSLVLTHKPTIVLIERQRFRTGGAAAVQEWTLRVNLLEHMMWACFRTLRALAQGGEAPTGALGNAVGALEAVQEVSPAKVAKFWCGGVDQDLRSEIGVSGISRDWARGTALGSRNLKADKIAVAQGWVDGWKTGADGESSVQLSFADSAAGIASAFQSSPGKRKVRKKKGDDDSEVEESIGKLDDLADCLLQGVAWVKWEENRRRLAQKIREADGGGGL